MSKISSKTKADFLNLAETCGVQVPDLPDVDDNQQHVVWLLGGDLFSFDYRGYTCALRLHGDTRAIFYKDGRPDQHITDRDVPAGGVYEVLRREFPTADDTQMDSLLHDADEIPKREFLSGSVPRKCFAVQSLPWFEWFIESPGGHEIGMGIMDSVCDSSFFWEAACEIEQVLIAIDKDYLEESVADYGLD